MITLKQAVKLLQESGVPIPYHTLYAWARAGVSVGGKPLQFATQIGNRWMVDEKKLQQIVDGAKKHERIQIQSSGKKKSTETRGRKPGTRFGSYKKRDAAAADRL